MAQSETATRLDIMPSASMDMDPARTTFGGESSWKQEQVHDGLHEEEEGTDTPSVDNDVDAAGSASFPFGESSEPRPTLLHQISLAHHRFHTQIPRLLNSTHFTSCLILSPHPQILCLRIWKT